MWMHDRSGACGTFCGNSVYSCVFSRVCLHPWLQQRLTCADTVWPNQSFQYLFLYILLRCLCGVDVKTLYPGKHKLRSVYHLCFSLQWAVRDPACLFLIGLCYAFGWKWIFRERGRFLSGVGGNGLLAVFSGRAQTWWSLLKPAWKAIWFAEH